MRGQDRDTVHKRVKGQPEQKVKFLNWPEKRVKRGGRTFAGLQWGLWRLRDGNNEP